MIAVTNIEIFMNILCGQACAALTIVLPSEKEPFIAARRMGSNSPR
jgi:hypothetical protein